MTTNTKRMRPQAAASMFLLLSAICLPVAAQGVYKQTHKAVTSPSASAAVPDVAQAVHIITALFPTAPDRVTGLQIRLEASYEGTTWFPITRDITAAEYSATGAAAYAIQRANGYYPRVRVNVVATSETYPLTVWYAAAQAPIGQIEWDGSRYAASPPAAADRVTWGLCPGANCAVAENITVPWIATRTASFTACYLAAKTAPTGAALTVDIAKNGTSIYSGSFPQLASGATYAKHTTFNSRTVAEGDLLTVSITGIGSTTPGKDLNVTCVLQ